MKQRLYDAKDSHTCPNSKIDEKIERCISEIIKNEGKDYDLPELECYVLETVMDVFAHERIIRIRGSKNKKEG